MTISEIQKQVNERSLQIAHILARGMDCELRKDASGVKIIEIKKTVVKN